MRTQQTLRLPGSFERQWAGPVDVIESSSTLAVPIETAREQCNLAADDCSFDTELRRYIFEAQEQVEYDTQQQLVPALLRQQFEGFPGGSIPLESQGPARWLQLGKRPLIEVEQLAYLDEAFSSQVVPASDYVVDTKRTPGHVRPSQAASFLWPTDVATQEPDNVTADFVGGMGDKFTADEIADTITTNYRYRKGQRIQFASLKADLPTPLEEATTYYVLTSGTTFQVSRDPSGTAIDLADTGTELQYVVRLTGLASQAVLLRLRQLFDSQGGDERGAVTDAYWRIISKMADVSYP